VDVAVDGFALSPTDISFETGKFHRPECVLATASGTLYTSDAKSGISKLLPDGTQSLIGGNPDAPERFKPNGFILMRDGSILFANLGADGGIWRISSEGALSPYLMEVDGIELPTVNFVWMDAVERIWFSVFTRGPRDRPFSTILDDGFVGLLDDRGVRIVADGFIGANECRVSPDGRSFVINETFGRRTTRFDLADSGGLSNRSTLADYGGGDFPDGMAFDVDGGLWVVSVVSNRIYRIPTNGSSSGVPHLVIEDCASDHLVEVERRLAAGTLYADFVYENHATTLMNTSSIAFGSGDLKTAYLGCISGDRIATFQSPVAGVPPVHWHWF